MLIREMSDLHLEFAQLELPVIENEDKMVLVLAGDIGVAGHINMFEKFLPGVARRHRDVIMVMGNHEHYDGSFQRSYEKIKHTIVHSDLQNVHLLENESIEIDDVVFVGATFWTDMNRRDPITLFDVQHAMNDYHLIRNGPKSHPYQRKLAPMDTCVVHEESKKYVFKEIEKAKVAGKKCVVVTHHAPSLQSIAEKYKHDTRINGAYASDLDTEIIVANPDVWYHGHTHVSFDYMIENTRVICNPRGYVPFEPNPQFDVNKVIEV